jgi:hypothetical protein
MKEGDCGFDRFDRIGTLGSRQKLDGFSISIQYTPIKLIKLIKPIKTTKEKRTNERLP